jgi:alkanesulfonate monooxygenase SsuD/methylene tetrahydromethanopterin reductase-like flavin-dependent oxidoreductase (luciferase family)
MEFGAHLPVDVGYSGVPTTAAQLLDYAQLAEDLGFAFVSANDHIVFRNPWLDGPMCLAAICAGTSRVRLATTSLIQALRQPVCVRAGRPQQVHQTIPRARMLYPVGESQPVRAGSRD